MSDMNGRTVGLIWILLCLIGAGAHPVQAGAVASGPATARIKSRVNHAASVSQYRLKNAPVSVMRARGLNVEYIEVPLMGHCGPLPIKVSQRVVDFVQAAMV
jgi:hypothetical protein